MKINVCGSGQRNIIENIAMATQAIFLQPEHGYIVLLCIIVAFVNTWAGFKVGAARTLYSIQYPQVRAT
jgi:hypothetical protein